ncbi:hypothetical protein SEA_BOBBY_166 [Mycobacterium phage Bobby]|nr:hypothetical protein SEA_BOBBY_166 [Mycobacterium phage Bobby]
MNDGKYYPRRSDGVYAITFDGSHESAQRIAGALGVAVQHQVPADALPGDTGGELTIPGEPRPARPGDVVVIFDSPKIDYREGQVEARHFQVIFPEEFHRLYSRDGL